MEQKVRKEAETMITQGPAIAITLFCGLSPLGEFHDIHS